jgi:hypothetical protein
MHWNSFISCTPLDGFARLCYGIRLLWFSTWVHQFVSCLCKIHHLWSIDSKSCALCSYVRLIYDVFLTFANCQLGRLYRRCAGLSTCNVRYRLLVIRCLATRLTTILIALLLWSLSTSEAASAPRVALSPRHVVIELNCNNFPWKRAGTSPGKRWYFGRR